MGLLGHCGAGDSADRDPDQGSEAKNCVGAGGVLRVSIWPIISTFDTGQQADEHEAKLKTATERFEMRCKSAGERISRTVQNVDGVVWMKWRAEGRNYADQFKLDDPFGKDCGGEGCIADLLRVTHGADLNPEEAKRHAVGYRYVEARIPDGDLKQYIGVIRLRPALTEDAIAKRRQVGRGIEPRDHEFMLERKPIDKLTARYGVTWDDVSTEEDRRYWIAGGSLKVLDLRTNEVIAERIGYMMDRGQGSTAGFRSPWGDAPYTACPAFSKTPSGGPFMSYRTRNFVLQVLQPIRD